MALGATVGSFTMPQSLRIARAISNATSIPADVAHHAVSQALMQPGTHGSGSGGSDKLPSPAALRGPQAAKRDRTSPLKHVSTAGQLQDYTLANLQNMVDWSFLPHLLLAVTRRVYNSSV